MRGDGRIFKQKDSRFPHIAYYHDKKEIRESTRLAILEAEAKKGRKLKADEAMRVARKYLRKRVREVANEKDSIRPFLGPATERITVSELLDDLVADYKTGGKKRIPRDPNSAMKSNLKSVRDYFGEMRAAAVTKRHVNQYIAMLKAERMSNATVNRRTQLLGQAFRIAAAADPPKVLRVLSIQKLDEDNVRKGKFTEQEAERVISSLPTYMQDPARFAYEVGSRRKELFSLRWSYVIGDGIEVPFQDTKGKKYRTIGITPEIKEILERRRAARVEGCDLIFHHDGKPIKDYRKCWQSACVINGLGLFYCPKPKCRGEGGEFTSVLDATRKCPKCGEKPDRPHYVGKLFHDFRRTCAHELWKAGATIEEAMEVTGHRTDAMFRRYADLFNDEERRSIQRKAQKRRHEWRKAERERAAQAHDAPSVGEGAPPKSDSERLQ